ncbi:MAG: efflux RND transporter permease subunit [Bacteroidetes bacterium]|nr:efflux RND transporter permease subunit [Bacteroidota bacterium]MCH8523987.1 efflux RND transporter permease subunit [Balneolales bacterium]
MSLTGTSIKRPIATTMVFLIVITLGTIGFRYLPVDLLPPIEFPQLTIQVSYDNVGPEEMERIITDQIENAIAGVPNVERVTSNSSEGNSSVTLNFAQGVNLDEATNDVRAALDRVRRSLPPEVDAPRIWKFDPNDSPIVMLGARSDRSLAEITRIVERDIGKMFEQIPGVGAINVWGGVNQEVRVDLIRDRMASSQVTAADIVQAITRENSNVPGGNVKEGLSDLYVRSVGEFTDIDQIANTIIRTVDGAPIRVRDVATVSLDYQDLWRYIEVDDLPMIRFGIRKQSGANTVAVAEAIRNEVDRINAMRNDLNLVVIRDQSQFIQASIDNVRNSAIWGGILAIVVLFAFLRNGSTTMIIGISIPISIIATFGLLYFNGLTLNQMSFGGLALGVGLIVDNAIVVLENIVRKRQNGAKKKDAARKGTREVTGAIIASTLTTSVIFLPVVFMNTITGVMFQELALVVVFALICSLFVALTLVPMLSSQFLTIKKLDKDNQKRSAAQRFFDRMDDGYSRIVSSVLHRKTWVFAITGSLLFFAYLGINRIPVELTPETESDEIRVRMWMDSGTNIAIINQYMDELDAIVREIVPREEIMFYTRDVRNGRGEIELALTPPDQRRILSTDLADDIRERVQGVIPGARIDVRAQSGLWILRRIFGSGGGDNDEAIGIQLRGFNLELAADMAQEIANRIEVLPGIVDVRVGQRDGRPEQQVNLDRERIAQLGIGSRDVAAAIQSNIGGSRAGFFRRDGDEIPITVRLRPEDRMSTLDIDNISVRTADGTIIPVSAVVTTEAQRGPESIRRENGQRITNITANLERGVPLGTAVEAIQRELADFPMPEGYSLYFGGEYEEQQKAQRDFNLAIIMALILIYMVMAAQFERFLDPLIVMFSVPLVIIGIVPTLLLTGTTLNLQSLMGVVMLIGIVVNNAILLVDYINLMRREHNMDLYAAVVEAGRLRLRPILMTTTTTVLGLLPLSFGIGTGGEIQASLARVVIGGLTASTLITLVFIPVVYVSANLAMEKIKTFLASVRGQEVKENSVAAESVS